MKPNPKLYRLRELERQRHTWHTCCPFQHCNSDVYKVITIVCTVITSVAAAVAVGLLVVMRSSEQVPEMMRQILPQIDSVTVALLVISAVLVIVSLLGCVGVTMENGWIIIAYYVAVFFVMAAEIAACALILFMYQMGVDWLQEKNQCKGCAEAFRVTFRYPFPTSMVLLATLVVQIVTLVCAYRVMKGDRRRRPSQRSLVSKDEISPIRSALNMSLPSNIKGQRWFSSPSAVRVMPTSPITTPPELISPLRTTPRAGPSSVPVLHVQSPTTPALQHLDIPAHFATQSTGTRTAASTQSAANPAGSTQPAGNPAGNRAVDPRAPRHHLNSGGQSAIRLSVPCRDPPLSEASHCSRKSPNWNADRGSRGRPARSIRNAIKRADTAARADQCREQQPRRGWAANTSKRTYAIDATPDADVNTSVVNGARYGYEHIASPPRDVQPERTSPIHRMSSGEASPSPTNLSRYHKESRMWPEKMSKF